MGHRDAVTIAETLRRIQRNELILPAIQREYVWKPSQVIKVFDSIMRGYPVGSFLSWKVEPATVEAFKFYGFMKDYSAFDNMHNPVLDVDPSRPVIAVLDGQQRLTSLNIGLRGTYAYRIKNGWSSKRGSYPVRRLYLNLLGEAEENEAGLLYDLRFLTGDQVAASAGDHTKVWFLVADIFDAAEPAALMRLPAKYGVGNIETAADIIGKLWDAVHKNSSLHFYEEEDQEIERVLDIFIRVNSGGTVLSYSDLLLSIATAEWRERDARSAVHNLVDSLNKTGQGFDFSQDTVLKSGLVLADVGDIAFKVKNFTTGNMAQLDAKWDAISSSLQTAVGLLSDFGLSGPTLSADSVLIPVACYVHSRGLGDTYRASEKEAADRRALRSWVLRSLIVRGVWGSGLDTLLRDLRQVIREEGAASFPIAKIEQVMARRGKPLDITDALVEDVLGLGYGGPRTFAVLATLFDHVDTRNQFHVDHVFPAAMLDKKALISANKRRAESEKWTEKQIEDFARKRDLLPNLELLEGPVNIGKSDSPPDTWAACKYGCGADYGAFLDRNALPSLPHDIDQFFTFFESRRSKLAKLIKQKLRTMSPSRPAAEGASVETASIDQDLAEADLDS
jgi:hypothetical protein